MKTEQPTSKMFTPLQTVVATLALFFGAQLIGAFLFFGIARNFGMDSQAAQNWLEQSAWHQFVFLVGIEGMILGGLWQLLKTRKIGFTAIGLNRPQAKYIAYAIGGFIVYFALYLVILIIAKVAVPALNLEQKQELGFSTTATGQNLLPIFVSLVILPPLVEELVMRGFLFTGLRTRLSFLHTALITSVLFAAAHLGEASDGLLWVAAIDTFVLSMVMCHVREKTGSLWPSIGMHFVKNGVAFFFLFNIAGVIR